MTLVTIPSNLWFIIWISTVGRTLALLSNCRQNVPRRYDKSHRCISPPFYTHYSSFLTALSNKSPSNPDDNFTDKTTSKNNNDWIEGELTLQKFQPNPSPDLTPETVAISCVRSLQFVDYPKANEGLERIFHYLTYECRKSVTARRGGDTVEAFCRHGLLSPALQPFMGARRVEIDAGNATVTPGTITRGDLVSIPVTIYGGDVLAFQHPSGMIKDTVGQESTVNRMIIRLEKVRRPPMSDCWLIREIMDVRHFFAGDMGNAGVGG